MCDRRSWSAGSLVAIGSAVAAALLINYFFVEPPHTLTIADPDQAVSLVVFVTVAALVRVNYTATITKTTSATTWSGSLTVRVWTGSTKK